MKVNAAVDIQPPQGRGGAGGAAPAAAAASPASEKLGEGIYLITGGYASIAIDFKDHITIIEAGQSEARGLAVIAEAKRLIPEQTGDSRRQHAQPHRSLERAARSRSRKARPS